MSRGVDFATIENAWLTGYTRFEKWRVQDEARFFRPLMQSMVAMHHQMLMQSPPEILAQIKAKDPQAWAKYEAFVQELLGTKGEQQEVKGAY